MSIEDDVEVVLKAQPWVPCRRCKGEGQTKYKSRYDVLHCICAQCGGKGYILRKGAKKAFNRVGAHLPNKPLTPEEVKAAQELEHRRLRDSAKVMNFSAYVSEDLAQRIRDRLAKKRLERSLLPPLQPFVDIPINNPTPLKLKA